VARIKGGGSPIPLAAGPAGPPPGWPGAELPLR